MLNYINILFLTLSLSFPANKAFSADLKDQQSSVLVKGISEEGMISEVEWNGSGNPSDAAKEIIHEIVTSVGLKPNFEIREANIQNAAAVNYKGRRFILYDAKFIERINQATQTDWAAVSILAHEIGHHLNGHTLLGKGNESPALELEADEFSGFVLRQMGATLEEAQKALRMMSRERGSHSHPGRSARMAAIENGYISANDRILAYADQPAVKMVASSKVKEKETRPSALALSEDKIYKEVHFSFVPDQTFYLTQELKLVAMTEKGPAEFGHLSKKKERLMLNVYDKKGRGRSFYVSGKGMLLDDANKVIGYIKNRK